MAVIVVLGVDPVAVKRLRALEDARQRVVVLHTERLGLVIVTAGAGYGTGHHRACDRVELLIGHVRRELCLIHLIESFRPEGEEARRDELACAFRFILRRQKITRDLLGDETIKRHIRIHRINDVITITPRMREGQVRLTPVRFREACHIQPVTAPPLAKARTAQQLVHHFLQSVGHVRRVGLVRQKLLHLLRCRRQADEIKEQPAQQQHRLRFRRGRQAVLLQLRLNKRIYAPCGLHRSLIAPKLPPRFHIHWRTLRDLRR